MDAQPTGRTLPCQQCGLPVPYEVGYTPWCDKCGWNMRAELPETPETPKGAAGLMVRLNRSLSQKSAQQLFEDVMHGNGPSPRRPIVRSVAYIIAVIVHSISLAILCLGIWVTLQMPLLAGVGLVCLAIAWVLRPRLGSFPRDTLSREQYPRLYELVDKVGNAIGAQPIDGIVITPRYDASIVQNGLRQRRVVFFGLPLLVSLTSGETVALVAHELAHTMNGDPQRKTLVGSALATLIRWVEFLDRGIVSFTDPKACLLGCTLSPMLFPLFVVMKLLSLIPFWLAFGLVHLLWRDSQRTEYHADTIAAQASGTEAMVSLISKFGYAEAYHSIAREIALKWDIQHGNVFDELQAYVAHMTPRETERIRRIRAEDEQHTPDTSHPASTRRMTYLQSHPVCEERVIFTHAQHQELLAELQKLHDETQRIIVRLHLMHSEWLQMQGSI